MPPAPLAALSGSTEGTAVAVRAGDGTLVTREAAGRARHSVVLLSLLGEALAEAGLAVGELTAVAFARGPGPFTAGRISTASAQGLGMALGVPLLPVSSLAALAHAAGGARVAAAMDAGQGEVYWGCYERGADGLPVRVGAETVAAPAAVALPEGEGWLGAGSGWATQGDALAGRLGAALAGRLPEAGVTAQAVAELGVADWAAGGGVAAAQALPTYLRASYVEAPA